MTTGLAEFKTFEAQTISNWVNRDPLQFERLYQRENQIQITDLQSEDKI